MKYIFKVQLDDGTEEEILFCGTIEQATKQANDWVNSEGSVVGFIGEPQAGEGE